MSTRDELIETISTDFSKFFHDPFLSTEQLNQDTTQTGYITINPLQLMMETGIQSGSLVKFYYNYPLMNPVYSTLQCKIRLSTMQNVKFFFGFSTNPTAVFDPSAVSGPIHYNGFYVRDGVLQAVSNNAHGRQEIDLADVDMTDVWLLKLVNDQCWIRPLPQIYPYFDGFRFEPYTRKWRMAAQTTTNPPENVNQYIIAYMTNETGANVAAEINHITFGERYVG